MSEFEGMAFDSEGFWDQVKRDVPGLELPERVGPADEEQAWETWHGYLVGRDEPTWHFDSRYFGKTMKSCWPRLAEIWISEASGMIEGTAVHGDIRIPYRPGTGLDWGANPHKSMSWGGLHYMTFLRWPIRAAMLTGEDRYVRLVADCIQSYLEQMDGIRDEAELMGRGIVEGGRFTVWNTLSVGMKLKALGEALYALRSHPAWTVADCRNTSTLIWRFAGYLYSQVSSQSAIAWQQQLNFISSGSSGLGSVGALLPEWRVADSWLETAKQIQEVLLLNQVYPDGFQKEVCTQYHKTVIRAFAGLQMILARRGLPSFYDTEPFRSRFLAMHHALAELRLPGGFTPAINSAVYAQDWPAFLAAANGFFKDPVLQWHLNQGYHRNHIPLQKGGPGWGNTILNDLCTPKVKGLQAKPLRTSSRLFPDAGVAVLRDGWGDDASVLVLDFGHPEGGHAYAGQASFTAWIKGRPAVLSPGSPFAYSDPEYQPWYYSTQGQNTVWIDGEDQETWRPGRKRRIWGRLLDWEEDRDRTRVRVSHDGYLASKGVRHERTVLFQKGRYFLVYDVLDGTRSEAERVLRWTIRCPDELTEKENRVVQSAGEVGLRMVPAWAESIQDVEIGWGPSMVPVTYQEDMTVQKAQVCHARLVQTLAAGETARYLVVMTAGDCGNTAVRAEVVGGKVEAEVTVDGQVDRVVLA